MGRLSLVSCSDPVQPPPAGRLGELVSALAAAGYDPDAEAIRELGADGWRRDPRRRAGMLNRAFADPGVEAVVDVSGGDLANEVLSYLDWGTIAANPKPVVGYSDLTCVLNAIVARTGRTAVLWNAMAGLHRGFGVLDAALASETIRPALAGADGDADAFEALPWLGGNLRCFLKLAGTRYWPDLAGSVLLVESLGASLKALAAGLAHHAHLGTFGKVAGIAVGQLTAVDEAGQREAALALVGEYAGRTPVIQAPGLGHSADSQAATLG